MPAQAASQSAIGQSAPATLQIDAFRSVLDSAGSALASSPDAIGRALLSGLNGFSAREAQARAQMQSAIDPTGGATGDTPLDALGAPLQTGDTQAAQPLSNAQMIAKSDAVQRRSMGMMMQTYNFAVESQLVTNAATTFTSSINTLIKTQ
jgi:hypothetical protein